MTDEPGALTRDEIVAGRYRVGSELGRGGMAMVYEARHIELDRTVALKVLRAELARSEKLRRRFMREARAAAKLESDHVALVLDVGVIGDEAGAPPYIAMERLRGRNLAEVIKERGPLPVDEAVDLVMQACVGVAEAHARGIVHRDLKPANLFLAERDDGTVRVKVLDFGIAKAVGTEGLDVSLTRSQDVFGTPYYMSPEQLRGAAQVDARTDLWSLGVVLYELLTAEMPFAGRSVAEVHAAVLEKAAAPVTFHREDVPEEIEGAIRRCLVKNAAERMGTIVELARSIAPLGSERARWWLSAVERNGAASAPARVTMPSVGEVPEDTLTTTGTDETPRLAVAQQTDTSWDSSTGASRGRARPLLFGAAALLGMGVVAGGLYVLRDDETQQAPAMSAPAPVVSSAAPATSASPSPEPGPAPAESSAAPRSSGRSAARAPTPKAVPSATMAPVAPPTPVPPPSPYDTRE